ncbi:hypothetical protein LLEC1_02045 [Akanthomyces lecanii]|uniref:Uncharacterized protein n=1 Tax=Cordyceps confragosa TaxID=2714763 RepID=A0A179ICW0_CORDF|nr:hypothetical protein LLEC1_02045 [Akanthomyces lecanii]
MAVQAFAAPGLGEAESHALRQYEKIVRFRDEILGGKHATIKVPEPLREAALSLSTDVIHENSAKSLPGQNGTPFGANALRAVAPSSIAAPSAVPPIEPRSMPISKTDELPRADLRLQRKQIEQELREDVQRHRNKKPGPDTQGFINASAILAAALILVPELNVATHGEQGAGNGNGPENDSFDDNTFYSSQHDTPEFQPASPIPVNIAATTSNIASAHPPPANTAAAKTMTARTQDGRRSVNQPRQLRTYDELIETPTARKQPSAVPGLNNCLDTSVATLSQPSTAAPSASASIGGQTALTQPYSYIDLHPPSPLLQNNRRALPTYPVQPPKPSEIPGLYGGTQGSVSNAGAPAQVAALRSEPGSRTSPESSSQGGQSKRKNRKKKRKSDKQTLENLPSFGNSAQHIKAEPRSPSPLAGPSYIRPNKRQRQLKVQNQDPSYDELSYDPALPSGPSKPSSPPQQAQYRQEQDPAGNVGTGMYFATAPTMHSNARVPREYVTERVITDDGYRREYVQQSALPYEYSSRGSHMSRPVHPDAFQDGALPFGNSPQNGRYSVHPEGDNFPEPTRSQPARILVDAYGREYIEPTRQIVRHSMAPSPLPGEPDRLYERAPAQPLARYQGPGALEERGYMFAQPASPYAAPRRILTQPEYVTYDNRDGRFREYSTRPLAAQGEFVPVRPQEHRLYADTGREYIGRASSMHPVDQGRVPSGLGTYGHASSVRPEASGVVYGIERSAQPAAIKSYGSWSGNQGIVGREGGGSLYAAATPNEAGSSRGVASTDAMYGRGNRQEGFRN